MSHEIRLSPGEEYFYSLVNDEIGKLWSEIYGAFSFFCFSLTLGI
jgi:hypothetical protein